ncbi:hypothetical protein PR002_g1650 [Phytophthora rubi]|uniref:Crinkler effector protein N-terminal domain-containing protein n=3 Tax=Phytophthora rubi TaxID=129364 RepID=A0A6A3NUS9_9STRA|nr:hypothetical protein PR002_g1650 [Phytophthora rubi]
MVEISLKCAIVGQPGTFDVTTDDGKKVSVLKKEIKSDNSTTITCDTKDLKLFLAKKDGEWMRDVDPAVLELREGWVHPDVQTLIDGKRMWETRTIRDVLEENHMTTPQSSQVHVLVVVPTAIVIDVGGDEYESICTRELRYYKQRGNLIKVQHT